MKCWLCVIFLRVWAHTVLSTKNSLQEVCLGETAPYMEKSHHWDQDKYCTYDALSDYYNELPDPNTHKQDIAQLCFSTRLCSATPAQAEIKTILCKKQVTFPTTEVSDSSDTSSGNQLSCRKPEEYHGGVTEIPSEHHNTYLLVFWQCRAHFRHFCISQWLQAQQQHLQTLLPTTSL